MAAVDVPLTVATVAVPLTVEVFELDTAAVPLEATVRGETGFRLTVANLLPTAAAVVNLGPVEEDPGPNFAAPDLSCVTARSTSTFLVTLDLNVVAGLVFFSAAGTFDWFEALPFRPLLDFSEFLRDLCTVEAFAAGATVVNNPVL